MSKLEKNKVAPKKRPLKMILILMAGMFAISLIAGFALTSILKSRNEPKTPSFTVPADYQITDPALTEYNQIIDKAVPEALAELKQDQNFKPFSYVFRDNQLQKLDLAQAEGETNADQVIRDIVGALNNPETSKSVTSRNISYKAELNGLDFPQGIVIELYNPNSTPVSLLLPYRFEDESVKIGKVTFTRKVNYASMQQP